MSIKMLAVDLDGTLIQNDSFTISDKNKKALKYAMDKGILFVPATGRMLSAIPEYLMNNGIRYIITTNGSKIIDTKNMQAIYSNPIDIETFIKLVKISEEFNIYYEIYTEGRSFSPKDKLCRIKEFDMPDRIKNIIYNRTTPVENIEKTIITNKMEIEKFNMLYVPPLVYNDAWKKFLSIDGISIVSSIEHNMEINKNGTSKWSAILELCRLLSILPSEVMAIGDSGNDVAMIKGAKIGVAMQNSYRSALEVADWVTDSNEQDGVAKAIYNFL